MKGGGGEGMKAATNEGRESSVRVVLARGHVTSLVRAGFFRWLFFVGFLSLVNFCRFFSSLVLGAIGGYDQKGAGAGAGLGTWFCRFVAGQREVGVSTKEVPKKTG